MSSDQDLRAGRLVFYENDLTRIDKILQELVDLSDFGLEALLILD